MAEAEAEVAVAEPEKSHTNPLKPDPFVFECNNICAFLHCRK